MLVCGAVGRIVQRLLHISSLLTRAESPLIHTQAFSQAQLEPEEISTLSLRKGMEDLAFVRLS